MNWINFFFGGWGTTFTAYVILQALVSRMLTGHRRMVSMIPILPMAAVVVLTTVGFAQESNLWPILLIFASPVALVFLAVVWLMSRKVKDEAAA